jgi:hypothetical protein
MAVYIVKGELGSGKSLLSVSRMQKALEDGNRVATNMDLFLERLVGDRKPRDVTRLPDHPKLEDFRALGRGHEGRKGIEKKFGLIVLDEAATFLNSREWAGEADADKSDKQKQAKARSQLIAWLRHARKFRWHLILITQDVESLDAQVRRALSEHVVDCRRLDRYTVPFVSWITKLIGLGAVTMPQMHIGVVYYKGKNKVETWALPFAQLIRDGYDTEQKILGDNDGAAVMLDQRHAPYMWRPRGLYNMLWRSFLWKWPRLFPPSRAQVAHDDFRLFDKVGALYKQPVPTYAEWLSARGGAAPETATRAAHLEGAVAGAIPALVADGEGVAARCALDEQAA